MTKLPALTLTIEVNPGADIKQASEELCSIARRLSRTVTTKFNGCLISAGSYTKVSDIMETYSKYCRESSECYHTGL